MVQQAKTTGGAAVFPKRRYADLFVSLLVAIFICGGAALATDEAPECKVCVSKDSDTLWQIVDSKCLQHLVDHDRYPCLSAAVPEGPQGRYKGYVLLKDLVGPAQVLLIPTQKISGIESPEILGAEATNYFAEAWHARSILDALAHKDLPRNAISLAINSKCKRSQGQVHIHIDCVRPDVNEALSKQRIGYQWAKLGVPLLGHDYMAMRVDGDQLGANPFKLLADKLDGASKNMGERTLVVIGATFENNQNGFIILESQFDLSTHNLAHGEDLQDHYCSIAWQGK